LPERGLPGGGQVGFLETADDGVFSVWLSLMDLLDQWSGSSFRELDASGKVGLVRRLERERSAEFREGLRRLVAHYYGHPGVLSAIGEEARAPFPDGHSVVEGDLTLLEPVVERGTVYRSET